MSGHFSPNKEFKTPSRIQRLESPKGYTSNAFGNAALGFKQRHLEALHRIVDFAYMGNSWFEGGELPFSLSGFSIYASKNKIVSFEQIVDVRKFNGFNRQTLEASAPVYVLCPRKYRSSVAAFLGRTEDWTTMERTYFVESMLAQNGHADTLNTGSAERTKGWFDLDNQVFFFTDKSMFDQVRAAFQVKDRTVPLSTGFEQKIVVGKDGPVPVGMA